MNKNNIAPVVSHTNAEVTKAMDALVSKTAPVRGILTSTVDVANLSVAERKGLLSGPEADIYVGNKEIFHGVPVRAFMAWSIKANNHFRANPLSKKIIFRETAANAQALVDVLRATVTFYGMGRDNLANVRIGNNIKEMVDLYQAGVFLGMSSRVEHIYKRLKHIISTVLLPYEDITILLTAFPESDSLFQHLATDLAYRRFKKRIPDPEDFDAYLNEHVALKNAMAALDAPHMAERKAAQEAREAKIKEDREWAAQEKIYTRERRARIAALQKKVNATKGGILTLMQEEADLKRELGI